MEEIDRRHPAKPTAAADSMMKGSSGAAEHEPTSEEANYDLIVIAELNRRLPDTDIKTCEDCRHLNVLCCDTCHNFYPHYEMKLIGLPDGSPAWVCDSVEWAIYPERHRELQEWGGNSPEGTLLRKIFGEDVDE